VRGHHVNVATPEDATTAKKNQTIYRFLPRAYWHNFIAAFRLEAKRLAGKDLPWFHWRNELIWWYGISLGLAVLCYLVWQWQGVLFFFAQSFVAFTTLESINYVEHYGLTRRKLANGRYERVRPQHSWNTSHMVSNMLLFQLQRHSDHHANPRRRYQVLRHHDDAPQLPSGYPAMMLLAWFPPLWFRVMNPKVEQFYRDREASDHRG
jgi:alkane 1-monooxygenase